MKKLIFATSLFALTGFAAEFKGTISDSKCGAAHEDASEKSMKCAQACVKGGKEAVFVSGGKVYKIADQGKVAEHVGHKVTLKGKMEGDTITVDSVSMD